MLNNLQTGTCNKCGIFNSSALRCNCSNKRLLDITITPSERELAFDSTGQYLSDSEIKDITPHYYGATCSCGAKLDPYIICDAYATNPAKGSAWHHAVKKLLRAGDGHKPLPQDVQEVIDTLTRWKEQINANLPKT